MPYISTVVAFQKSQEWLEDVVTTAEAIFKKTPASGISTNTRKSLQQVSVVVSPLMLQKRHRKTLRASRPSKRSSNKVEQQEEEIVEEVTETESEEDNEELDRSVVLLPRYKESAD